MFLGIDVAKAKFDAVLLSAEAEADSGVSKPKHKVFPNSADGFAQLAAWLGLHRAPAVVHACLEATGPYGEALARHLVERGQRVSVVNPAAIRAFAASQLSRTKTDKADAFLIARYCRMYRPPAWTPPAAELAELQALCRRLDALRQMRQREQNRLGLEPASVSVRDSITATVSFLAGQIATTEQAVRDHVAQYPSLREQVSLLQSIPGVGFETATTVLAEVGDVSRFRDADALCAFAGLVPRLRESGSSVRGRAALSKVGSPRLRKALFFPAMVGGRVNPTLAAFRERLLSRGKSRLLVVGALMRKMLRLIFGVLKAKRAFDPHFAA